MPTIDLLLPPFLGAYLFLKIFHYSRFNLERMERQRLIFLVSVVCIVSSSVLIIIVNYIRNFEWGLEFLAFISAQNPIRYAGLNMSLGLFIGPVIVAALLNLLIRTKKALHATVNKYGDQYDKLFWDSMIAPDREKLLLVTTTKNKVYVSYLSKIDDPIGDPYVTFIPLFSGFRDTDTHRVEFTTDYTGVMEALIEQNLENEIADKFGVTILKSNIFMVSKFNIDLFNSFRNQLDGASTVSKDL